VLKHRTLTNQILFVATTHILFNQNRGDTKLGQVLQITRALQKLQEVYGNRYFNQESFKTVTIFAGDFNAIPCSGVYKLLTEGSLDLTNLENRKVC
jgi:mRNA deadenylase 3'-5' endonuclease subunit Ccr4